MHSWYTILSEHSTDIIESNLCDAAVVLPKVVVQLVPKTNQVPLRVPPPILQSL